MQKLVTIRDNEVVVQDKNYTYSDTYTNFLKDGFDPLPKSIVEIDYNEAVQQCIINGVVQENWQNEYAQKILSMLESIRVTAEKRQQEARRQEALKHEEARISSLSLEDYIQERLKDLDRVVAPFEDNINKDMYFTSSLGFRVNGDRRTSDNIQYLIMRFDANAQDGHVLYRDYDNNNQLVTKEQLNTMLAEHADNGLNLYQQKWKYEEEIEAAVDKDSLKKMEFTFTMSDFTGVTIGA